MMKQNASQTSSVLKVRRAAVLGSGTMGAQIAGVLANAGIPCDLLDLPSSDERNRLAEGGKGRLLSLRPSPIYGPDVLSLIRPGNFSDDLPRLTQADWVVEAVVEQLEPKQKLWREVAYHLRPDAVISTNTSGIPIASIAEALPEQLRPRFLGTHFFNPPRHLHLLELIPTSITKSEVVNAFRRFAEDVLGKGVVVAKDVPGFTGNRIGTYGLMVTLKAAEEFGLAPDEVDSITGQAMGRPNSATYRTLDLVGLDVIQAICETMQRNINDLREREAFLEPPYLRELVQRRWTGEKTGQGFYKREAVGGQTQILTLDVDGFQYRPRRAMDVPSLAAVRDLEDPGQRIKRLVNSDDPAGRFAWRVLSQTLVYAAQKAGEVADDIVSIDRAMQWGFGWELGPFETWDILGVPETVERMLEDDLPVPEWVVWLAESDGHFFQHNATASYQATPQATLEPILERAVVFPLQRLLVAKTPVFQRATASLHDLGDGVAFLDLFPPRQMIGPDMAEAIEEACLQVPRTFRGLVLGSHRQPNFCTGTNLSAILQAAQAGKWNEVDGVVRRLQEALLRLKRLPVPVVATCYGATQGIGADLALSATRMLAAAETYIGLTDVQAGLIPFGGVCKEALAKAVEGRTQADAASSVARWFEAICLGRVSGSAVEARSLGFLRSDDTVVPNVDHLLYEAKESAIALQSKGYAPRKPASLPVLGHEMRSRLEQAAQETVWKGRAIEHDLLIARKLAYVLTGGDLPSGSVAPEENFLDLEREAFLSLCGEPKTQARMEHLLKTGRPLRN